MIKARLPAEAGAVFLKALEAAENALPPPDVSAATSLEPVQSRSARRADALGLMAKGFLAAESPSLSGGDRQQIVVLIENEQGEPLNIGRKTRTIPPALRRALKSSDQGCRFPGCTHTRFVDGQSFESPAPGALRQVDWMQLVAAHQARHINVTPRTAVTRWQGESLDYGLAVEGLLQRANRAENVAARGNVAGVMLPNRSA